MRTRSVTRVGDTHHSVYTVVLVRTTRGWLDATKPLAWDNTTSNYLEHAYRDLYARGGVALLPEQYWFELNSVRNDIKGGESVSTRLLPTLEIGFERLLDYPWEKIFAEKYSSVGKAMSSNFPRLYDLLYREALEYGTPSELALALADAKPLDNPSLFSPMRPAKGVPA